MSAPVERELEAMKAAGQALWSYVPDPETAERLKAELVERAAQDTGERRVASSGWLVAFAAAAAAGIFALRLTPPEVTASVAAPNVAKHEATFGQRRLVAKPVERERPRFVVSDVPVHGRRPRRVDPASNTEVEGAARAGLEEVHQSQISRFSGRAAVSAPSEGERAFLIGWRALRDGDASRAVPWLAKAASKGERGLAEDALFWLGIARLRSGDSEGARNDLLRFIRTYPDSPRRVEAQANLDML